MPYIEVYICIACGRTVTITYPRIDMPSLICQCNPNQYTAMSKIYPVETQKAPMNQEQENR
jgi:hypothetical protein